MRKKTVCFFTLLLCLQPGAFSDASGGPWVRHTIDDSSRGADGVRLADLNHDGLLDVVTGWEEGGVIRVYLNPGPARAKDKWPAVTVGKSGSVEDAVPVDLDGDGVLDVVSSSEGKVRSISVHWGPKLKSEYLNSAAWKTEVLPASQNRMMWMFCLPLQVDGKHGIDLIAGGKGPGAQIGWFEAPPDPRALSGWTWHPLREAGWIMSLVPADMDGDDDLDIVITDRKDARSGCYWLENPGLGKGQTQLWREHLIGGAGRQVMFLKLADLDRDGLQDVLVAMRPNQILYLRRKSRDGKNWQTHPIELPERSGGAKAVTVGDIDRDGKPDLVFTCEQATHPLSGVMWLSYRDSVTNGTWQAHEISGADGIKHDLIELLDLDGDGDLDAISCEETKNLGVFWYENPAQ